MTPFGIAQGSQFRPATTLDVTSAAYATAYNEVKSLGQDTSSTRTVAQTTAAYTWADPIGSVTAAGHWNQIATQMIKNAGLDSHAQARILATLSIAVADATISAFDASYANDNWRPVTGIAYGGDNVTDYDGNPLTTGDPNWNPLVNTPPMPSFANVNTAIAKAAANILKHYFGNIPVQVQVDTNGDGIPDATLTYANIDAVATDVADGQIAGGTDFRYATDAAALLGNGTSNYDFSNYFLQVAPVPEPSSLLLVGGALVLTRRRRRVA